MDSERVKEQTVRGKINQPSESEPFNRDQDAPTQREHQLRFEKNVFEQIVSASDDSRIIKAGILSGSDHSAAGLQSLAGSMIKVRATHWGRKQLELYACLIYRSGRSALLYNVQDRKSGV